MSFILRFKNFLIRLVFFTLVIVNNLAAENKENYLGKTDAENVLVEYASLSCVHCANFHIDNLPTIKKELIETGKLKYIYRDFPLDRPAMIASMVSNCYTGGQYFEVLNTLFRSQRKWVVKSENKEDFEKTLFAILKVHGITLDNIKSCTVENDLNKKKWNSILKVRLEAQKLGVNSTPSFFLNGERLSGLITSEVLKKLVK